MNDVLQWGETHKPVRIRAFVSHSYNSPAIMFGGPFCAMLITERGTPVRLTTSAVAGWVPGLYLVIKT